MSINLSTHKVCTTDTQCRYVYKLKYLLSLYNKHTVQIYLYTQVLTESVQQTHSVDRSIHIGTYRVCTTDTQCRQVYTPMYLHGLYNRHTVQIGLYTQLLTGSVQQTHSEDRSIHLGTYRVCTIDTQCRYIYTPRYLQGLYNRHTVQICLYTQVLTGSVQQTHSEDRSIHLDTFRVYTTDTQCRQVYTPRYLQGLHKMHIQQKQRYTVHKLQSFL